MAALIGELSVFCKNKERIKEKGPWSSACFALFSGSQNVSNCLLYGSHSVTGLYVLSQCWPSATLDLSLEYLSGSDLSLSDSRFVDFF